MVSAHQVPRAVLTVKEHQPDHVHVFQALPTTTVSARSVLPEPFGAQLPANVSSSAVQTLSIPSKLTLAFVFQDMV
jgi:hypothetical protein